METLDMLAGDNVLIGYDELVTAVGAESANEVMASLAANGYKPRKAGVVTQGRYGGLKSRFVGVPSKAALAVGASHTAIVYATNPFNAERFTIPRDIVESVVITDWRIGDLTVLWSPGATAPIPGDMFAPDSFTNHVNLDTISETRGMNMTFQNVGAAAIDFHAGFVGTGATS
jgi:hypothetical protein